MRFLADKPFIWGNSDRKSLLKTIKTVTVSREAGQYHASILTEFPEIKQVNKGSRIALDMGVKTFATASNDNDISLPDIADEEKR